jgi:hypothetical protein
MSAKKSRKGIGGPKPDPRREALMKEYGFSRRQLPRRLLNHLDVCTELGREILLIMMRLDREMNVTAAAKSAQARIGRERIQARQASRALYVEPISRAKEREVSRMLELALKVRVA